MPTFNNMQGLEKYLQMSIEQVLDDVADDTVEFLTSYIDAHWYRGHSQSDYYTRFRDFIKSVTKSKVKRVGNSFEIEVYFDSDKLQSEDRPPGEFNARMSVNNAETWKGQYLSDWIPIFIEEGFKIFDIKEYDGIHMVEETKSWLNDELELILRKAFKKAGIEISVR